MATLVPVGRVAAAAGDLTEATCHQYPVFPLFISQFISGMDSSGD